MPAHADPSSIRRRVVRGGLASVAAVASGAAAATAVATYFARKVVTPDHRREDDVEILAVDGNRITMRGSPDTLHPGRYGLWLAGGAGHARLGEVIEVDDRAGTVTRVVEAVDRGSLRPGPARWNQYYYAGTPRAALGLDYRDVPIASDVGDLPCWLVPAGRRWAILIHGRGATREECLRALPVLNRIGYTSLVVTYRNDPDAPRSPAGRYHLGDREWRDVDAALDFALSAGARDVVLVGWSMGAAIALQTLTRSPHGARVSGLVLDAPVLDWRHVLGHHARLNRVPAPVARLGLAILSRPGLRRLAGVEHPLDLDGMDWVARADHLPVPVLVVHSSHDEFVPAEPSVRLAQARPDLVTLIESGGARHTKEWNVDPEAWDTAVARFLLDL